MAFRSQVVIQPGKLSLKLQVSNTFLEAWEWC